MDVTFEAFDPDNQEHALLIYRLSKESADSLLDDHIKDPILMIQDLAEERTISPPNTMIVSVGGERAGFIRLMDAGNKVGFLHGAMAKRHQGFYPSRKGLLAFCKYCFDILKYRKIKAQVPIFNRKAELVVRSVGFRKEGIGIHEIVFRGKPVNTIELALLPWYMKEKHVHEKIQKQRKELRPGGPV